MLKNMSKQQVFDQVVAHLRKQNCKSLNDNKDQCLYRGNNGLMCAAGCLIEDAEYDEWMEGLQFREAILSDKRTPESLVDRLGVHRQLINELQVIHDTYNVDKWEYKFQSLADRYDLQFIPNDLL